MWIFALVLYQVWFHYRNAPTARPVCFPERCQACRDSFGLEPIYDYDCQGKCGLCELCEGRPRFQIPQCERWCTLGQKVCTEKCQRGKEICLSCGPICGVYWRNWNKTLYQIGQTSFQVFVPHAHSLRPYSFVHQVGRYIICLSPVGLNGFRKNLRLTWLLRRVFDNSSEARLHTENGSLKSKEATCKVSTRYLALNM